MYNILVTGVGAIIGYGIVRSLRKCKYPVNIVGMDIFSDAVGQHWCNQFEQALPAAAPDYPEFIRNLIRKHSIDLVIPGIEQDITRLVAELPNFKDLNTKFVLNNPELIRIADDKWLTHLKLRDAGIPVIKTFIDGNFNELALILGVPFLLKPRRSYASKGIYRIYTEEDFLYWQKKLGMNFMVQEIVGDEEAEFTIGSFGYGDGQCSDKIIFQRKLSKEGATAKAKIVVLPQLESEVDQLAKVFKPNGPTNFQFRLHKYKYLLLEINPRISSSTSMRTHFSYNEAEMCIDYYLKGIKPVPIPMKQGFALRYIEDMVIEC